MTIALILFILGFLAVLVTPAYYLSVAKPWRNPIGRLMLTQMGVFILLYSRSAIALFMGAPFNGNVVSNVLSGLVVIFLWSFIPVYEYVRRKDRRATRRLQRGPTDRGTT